MGLETAKLIKCFLGNNKILNLILRSHVETAGMVAIPAGKAGTSWIGPAAHKAQEEVAPGQITR